MKIPMLLLLPAALLAGPVPAHAQGCATSPDAAEVQQDVGEIFFDPEQADVRAGQVSLLAPGEPQYLVQDSATCEAVVAAAVARMRQDNTIWQNGEEGPIEALVFRFGPYYAVTLTPTTEDPDPVDPNVLNVTTGHAPVVILRASDLVYLHTVYM